MKRVVLAAVAAMTVLGHVNFASAAAKDDVRTDERSLDKAGKEAALSGHSDAVKAVYKSVTKSYSLSATEASNLAEVLKLDANDRLRSLVSGISAESATTDLNKELLRAASNLKGVDMSAINDTALQALDSNKRNEQNAVSMVIGAGKQAKDWSADTRANFTLLLKSFNDHRQAGEPVAKALESAKGDLLSQKKVSINLDDLRKLCEG